MFSVLYFTDFVFRKPRDIFLLNESCLYMDKKFFVYLREGIIVSFARKCYYEGKGYFYMIFA